jgi:hypothetical protein
MSFSLANLRDVTFFKKGYIFRFAPFPYLEGILGGLLAPWATAFSYLPFISQKKFKAIKT